MSSMLEDIERINAKLKEGEGLVSFEGYCTNSNCMAREIRVHLKNHDDPLLEHAVRCPMCRSRLKLHWVRTYREEAIEEDKVARRLVNMQMHYRDYPERLGVISAAVLCDDRLPPTPPGWFDDPSKAGG